MNLLSHTAVTTPSTLRLLLARTTLGPHRSRAESRRLLLARDYFWPVTPGRTLHRIRVDYVGPFERRTILNTGDVHSKYIDAHVVSAETTSATLAKLRHTFAIFGLPRILVSDNGSSFNSEEFNSFVELKNINTPSLHLLTQLAMV